MTKPKNMSLIAKAMLFLSTIIWGSSFFILKNTLDEMPLYFILSIRFLVGALLLFLVGCKNWKKLNKKYLWAGGITGVFLALAYITQTIGLQYTTPSKNAFLTTFYCILVPFFCWGVTKKAPDKFNLVAAMVCLTGIGLVSLGSDDIGFNFMGDGMTLICGIFYALQIVAVELWGKDMDVILYTAFQFFAAFIICFAGFLLFEEAPASISLSAIGSLAYVSVFATTLAFLLMNVGVKYASASSSSLILSCEAVFGVLFSILFYPDEHITPRIVCGFVVMFIGIVINETKLSFLRKEKVKV